MSKFMKIYPVIQIVVCSIFLNCCENNINVRGTYIPGEILKTLKENEDTKTSVLNKIGSPYLIINSQEWLYLSRREKASIFSSTNIQEKNIKLKFDSSGRLIRIELLELKTRPISGSVMLGTDVNQSDF